MTRASNAKNVGITERTVFAIPVMFDASSTSWIVGIATADMTMMTITIEITKSTGFTAPLNPLLNETI